MRGKRVLVSLVAIVALLFGIYAVGTPVVEITMFGYSQTATFAELGDWSVAVTLVRVMNVAAILMLLVPMFSQPNENGMCHVGVSLAAVLELVGAGFFVMMKEKAVTESGLQGLMDLLSVEYNVTSSFVQMVWSAVAVLVCGLILVYTEDSEQKKGNPLEGIVYVLDDVKDRFSEEKRQERAEARAEQFRDFLYLFSVENIGSILRKIGGKISEWKFLLRKDVLGYQVANLCAIAVAFVLGKGMMDANLNGLLISVAVIASMGVVAGGIDFAVWKTIGNKTC